MIKKRTSAILLLLLITICGCQSTQEKVGTFISQYNNQAASMSNNIISRTKAELEAPNQIRIVFNTTLRNNSENREIYGKLLPSMTSTMMGQGDYFKDLIEEGVTFNFVMLSVGETELAAVKLDQSNVGKLALEHDQTTKKLETATGDHDYLSAELKQIVGAFNAALPIVNKEAGTKITTIDINREMELVYTIEVTNDLAKILADKDSQNLNREAMLRDANIRSILPQLRKYNIKTIKYIYVDSKGKLAHEMSLTENDFQ